MDKRKNWSAERRNNMAAAQRAAWQRRRTNGTAGGRPRLTRPWLNIFEECLEALRVRAWQLEHVVVTLNALNDQDEVFLNVYGMAQQHREQIDFARQALQGVIRVQMKHFMPPLSSSKETPT